MKVSDLEGLEQFTKTPQYVTLDEVDIHTPDGLFIKTFALQNGMLVPEHAHTYSHTTLVCKGKVHAWKDKKSIGEFKEGDAIEVVAGEFHSFYAIEDSRLACIHNENNYVSKEQSWQS